MALPTVIWWKTSILWVALVSIYANAISQATAWMTNRVEVRAELLQAIDEDRAEYVQSLNEHQERVLARIDAQSLATLLWLREIAGDVWYTKPHHQGGDVATGSEEGPR